MKRHKVYEKYGSGAKTRGDKVQEAEAGKIGAALEVLEAAGRVFAEQGRVRREFANGVLEEKDIVNTRVFRFIKGHMYREILYRGMVLLEWIEDTGLREREVDDVKVLVSVRDTPEWAGFWRQKEIEARGLNTKFSEYW